jgi:ABC-type branched-subunit amino acid transport system substrate-binding protein
MLAKAALQWTVTMVTSGPLTDEQYLAPGKAFADGTLGFCHFEDPEQSRAPGFEAYRKAMARYRPAHPLNRYSLYGYVFGRLVAEGLQRAGPELTRERFIDAMETIADWDAGGALPPVTFSSANHHAQRAGFICELRGGRFRRVSAWLHPER